MTLVKSKVIVTWCIFSCLRNISFQKQFAVVFITRQESELVPQTRKKKPLPASLRIHKTAPVTCILELIKYLHIITKPAYLLTFITVLLCV